MTTTLILPNDGGKLDLPDEWTPVETTTFLQNIAPMLAAQRDGYIDVEKLAALREPFEPHQIGKLPRYTGRKEDKGKNKHDCQECGGYHDFPSVHLDFVGHAGVTDRLLKVDPLWTWEPCAFDDQGLPLIRIVENEAMLWIRLTVCGVTRLGVGIVSVSSFELEKQLIGDALRNAAMRFGVALDLWSKQDLHDTKAPPEPNRAPRKDGAGGERAWNPRNPAEAQKLWQLQLRIRSLPPDVTERLAERWKETEALAGRHVAYLTAGQYRVAKGVVDAHEKIARDEDPKWKAPPAQREVLAVLGSILNDLANGLGLTPVPPEAQETPQEPNPGSEDEGVDPETGEMDPSA